MLRNRRGATSLRWLRALLDHGIEVHGQVVVCPGVNDGAVLDDTLAGVLDEYPELASRRRRAARASPGSTPSRRCAPHTTAEAAAVVDAVEDWQDVFLRRARPPAGATPPTSTTCWPAGRSRPPRRYEGFPMHEDGIGMARTFELEFTRPRRRRRPAPRRGFFASVDGAAARRLPNAAACTASSHASRDAAAAARRVDAPVGILTGELGASVLAPLVAALGRDDVRVIPVANEFFGGNTA